MLLQNGGGRIFAELPAGSSAGVKLWREAPTLLNNWDLGKVEKLDCLVADVASSFEQISFFPETKMLAILREWIFHCESG